VIESKEVGKEDAPNYEAGEGDKPLCHCGEELDWAKLDTVSFGDMIFTERQLQCSYCGSFYGGGGGLFSVARNKEALQGNLSGSSL